MKKTMKLIDILGYISVGENIPKRIRYDNIIWNYDSENYDYANDDIGQNLFSDYINSKWYIVEILNTEVEILDEEDEKDIPLIPDDGLYEFNMKDKLLDLDNLNYNFKVLKEKINQVVEEFNEYRKEVKENG